MKIIYKEKINEKGNTIKIFFDVKALLNKFKLYTFG